MAQPKSQFIEESSRQEFLIIINHHYAAQIMKPESLNWPQGLMNLDTFLMEQKNFNLSDLLEN